LDQFKGNKFSVDECSPDSSHCHQIVWITASHTFRHERAIQMPRFFIALPNVSSPCPESKAAVAERPLQEIAQADRAASEGFDVTSC
jgi:hypothetical protein